MSKTSENDDRKATERMCAVTRNVLPVDELLRFVHTAEGELALDLRCRLPGRGVWITAQRLCIRQAVRKNVFGRGLKISVKVPPDLENNVDAALEKAALGMLSMCNKAGCVVPGFAKVESAIERQGVLLVLHALNGAADSLRKMRAAAWRTGQQNLPFLAAFTSHQMSVALGRENVIHAALLTNPVSDAAQTRIMKLVNYRAEAGLPVDTGQAAGTDTE
jgi:predicted RNA-binding protein YlxR (DUF448 family)